MIPAPLPPRASGVPLVGDTVEFGRDPRSFVLRRRARFGPVFQGNVLGAPTTILVGPEALRFALVTHREHFTSGPGWPAGLRALMDGSLMMQDGEAHQRTRRLLAPAFAGPAVAGYAPTMIATARRHLARWAQAGELRLYEALKHLTFDVASQLLFGAPEGSDDGRLGRLFATFTAGMAGLHPMIPLRLPFTPFGRAFQARAALLGEVAALLRARVGKGGRDAAARLLAAREEQGGVGLDELAEQALFLLFAGHESTTSLMTSACLELARCPALLARARDEQRALGDAPLTAELAERMPLLDRILLETERLHPPFSGSFRCAARDLRFNGYRLPAGGRVFYSIAGTHQDPAVFADPARFDPDRFLSTDAGRARRDLGLVGFGAGARVCLGMGFARLQAKLLLALLLRDYRWALAPAQRLDWVQLPSLFPKDGLRVRFEARREGS